MRKTSLVLILTLLSALACSFSTYADNAPKLPADAFPVPLIVQATNYSCGPAALLGVLYYWKAYEGVETELYKVMDTTEKDGTEPEGIANAATSLKLEVSLKRDMTLDDLRGELATGATVILDIQSGTTTGNWKDEWESGHYVVLVAMDSNYAYFMDPAVTGAYEYVPLAELVDRWHDYENRHGPKVINTHVGISIRGKNPITAFPGKLVRLGE